LQTKEKQSYCTRNSPQLRYATYNTHVNKCGDNINNINIIIPINKQLLKNTSYTYDIAEKY